MVRFGFTFDDFAKLASLMADCILRNKDISEDVAKLRSEHLEMQYCFKGEEFDAALEALVANLGV